MRGRCIDIRKLITNLLEATHVHLNLQKEGYFNCHSDTCSVQENFNLIKISITSFIQDSVDKHIPSKTCRSVSSVPWITHEVRRKICKKNETRAKAINKI